VHQGTPTILLDPFSKATHVDDVELFANIVQGRHGCDSNLAANMKQLMIQIPFTLNKRGIGFANVCFVKTVVGFVVWLMMVPA